MSYYIRTYIRIPSSVLNFLGSPFQYIDDEIMRYLLDLLRLDQKSEEEKVLLAAGTVGNLSSDKPYLKRLIYNNEGIERVVEALTITTR